MAYDATHAKCTAALELIRRAVDLCETVPNGRRVVGEALCAGLDTVAAGHPQYVCTRADMRSEAEFWADLATPAELEIVSVVALARLKKLSLADRARNRLLRDLWGTLNEKERAQFLDLFQSQDKPP